MKPKKSKSFKNDLIMDKESGKLLFRGVPIDQMLSYPLAVAALVLGVSYTSLWRKVSLGHLSMSAGKLISRSEIDRYLAEKIKPENAA